jgi:hypothetical protein
MTLLLKTWSILLESASAQQRKAIANALKYWQKDVDLASVCDFEAVAKLPDADWKDWQALWAEVDDLLGDKNKERSASR